MVPKEEVYMADSEKSGPSRFESSPSWLFGAGAALAAFVVYLLTSASIAFPGRSIDILVNYGHVKGVQPLLYPLYEGVAGLFAKIPLFNLPMGFALLSSLSAWGALTLLFGIMTNLVYRTIEDEMDLKIRWRAALVAGLVAVVFLAFCKPFWYAANRADYACFHLFIFLAMVRLFIYWSDHMNRDWVLALFAFFYGLGIVEFATFIIFAPLFGLSVLVMMAIAGRLSTWRVIMLVLCGVLGLSLYGWTAWRYFHAPYVLAPASGVFESLVFVIKAQLNLILRSLPTVGWLIVGITTFIPWVILLPLHRRGLRSETGWSFIGLHVVFSVLLVALLFDYTLSPWRMLGERNLLVTPYLCAAMVFGYLVAFWMIEENNPWPRAKSARIETFRKRLCRVMSVLLAVLVLVPIVKNFQASNVRQARVFDVMARQIITAMGGRTWLVTEGLMDNHIILAARDMKKDVRLLDMSRGEDKRQMKAVADQFDSIRLKNQAELGMVPFLQEWMRMDPEVDQKLALMNLPDLWYGADRIPVPYGLIFLSYPNMSTLDLDGLRTQDRAAWGDIMKMAPKKGTPTALGMWGYFSRQMSMMANNLGVLLEDGNKPQEAYATYGLSRSMESNNLSALLNQYAMIQGGFKAPDAAAITNQLAQMEVGGLNNYMIWSLSRYYGYVRSPQAFTAMGWTWALSGYPGLAVSGLKRALSLSKNAQVSDNVDTVLASIYMTQGLNEESGKIFTRMLEKDKLDVRALLGMAELALRWKKPADAKQYIERAAAAGANRAEVAQAWALYHIAIGENDQARVFLEELVGTSSGMTTPWHMLANVLLVQKDTKALERMAKQIKDLKRQDFHTCRALAICAASKDDGPAMREYLEQALRYKPRDAGTLDLLLHTDVKEGRQDLAEQHASDLLRAQPDHPYANYVIGSLQMKRREYKLAEDSLSRSLAERRTPETLNDLAWAILMDGRADEAEKLAKDALAQNNQLAQAWDTLGMVYLKQGKIAEAREAVQKALNMYPKMPQLQLHLAQVEMAAKNYKAADELIQKVMPNADKMWTEEREMLQNLSRQVREALQ
jgi:tetratricopeptide (TPR) repeat protein